MISIVYAGSPEPAARLLQTLLEDDSLKNADVQIVGVLTNPPAMQGRHKMLVPTPVETVARQAGISVFTPEHLDSVCREQIIALHPELLVCFAYGHIFGPKFLGLFEKGAINVHPSLLPKYRGATPVPAAILHRDTEIGISVQRLALEMDAGDILAQKKIPLVGSETTISLLETSAKVGAQLVADLLCTAARTGSLPEGTPQQGEPSYTKMISKDDARINWTNSAADIEAMIRAYTPDPCCWTMCNDVSLKILKAALPKDVSTESTVAPGTVVAYDKKQGILIQTGDGLLAVLELQWQAKKAMLYKDFMNGSRNFVGSVLQ